jgi:hypothetical protein
MSFPSFSSFPAEALKEKQVLKIEDGKITKKKRKSRKDRTEPLTEEFNLDFFMDRTGDQLNVKYQEIRNQPIPKYKRINKPKKFHQNITEERIKYRKLTKTKVIKMIPKKQQDLNQNIDFIKFDDSDVEQEESFEEFKLNKPKQKEVIIDNPTTADQWIKFIQSQKLSHQQILALYKQAIHQLSSVDFFIRFINYLKESGYTELCIGLYQALIEFNVYKPKSDSINELLYEFESFWESEVPRFGEDDAKGFKAYSEQELLSEKVILKPKSKEYLDDLEIYVDEIDRIGSLRDPIEKWVLKEGLEKFRWPVFESNDPFEVVLFDDIKDYLFIIQNEEDDILIGEFLVFLGFGFVQDKYVLDPRFYSYDALKKNEESQIRRDLLQVEKDIWRSPIKQFIKNPLSFTHSHLPVHSLHLKYIKNILNTTKNPINKSLLLWISFLENEKAEKVGKRFLKDEPGDLKLWSIYARIVGIKDFTKGKEVFQNLFKMLKGDEIFYHGFINIYVVFHQDVDQTVDVLTKAVGGLDPKDARKRYKAKLDVMFDLLNGNMSKRIDIDEFIDLLSNYAIFEHTQDQNPIIQFQQYIQKTRKQTILHEQLYLCLLDYIKTFEKQFNALEIYESAVNAFGNNMWFLKCYGDEMKKYGLQMKFSMFVNNLVKTNKEVVGFMVYGFDKNVFQRDLDFSAEMLIYCIEMEVDKGKQRGIFYQCLDKFGWDKNVYMLAFRKRLFDDDYLSELIEVMEEREIRIVYTFE